MLHNQDVNILETFQTYSSRASKVSYLRIRVTLRASLLGTNPIGLPKMKMPKKHSSVNHKDYSIAAPMLSVTLRDWLFCLVSESQVVDLWKKSTFIWILRNYNLYYKDPKKLKLALPRLT